METWLSKLSSVLTPGKETGFQNSLYNFANNILTEKAPSKELVICMKETKEEPLTVLTFEN